MSERTEYTWFVVESANNVDGEWIDVEHFATQAEAEQYLHRTGPWEGQPLLITADHPLWRIVREEAIVRATAVAAGITPADFVNSLRNTNTNIDWND